MQILAQITETTKVVSQVLTDSTQFGPITYILIVFLIMVSVERFLNLWYIARPESIARREAEKSIAISLNIFATNGTAQTSIMQQMVEWQKNVDSGIRELIERRCKVMEQNIHDQQAVVKT